VPNSAESFGVRVLKSAFLGAAFAIVVGVLAYAFAPFFDAVGVYITPARLLLPIIGPFLPLSVVYRLVPAGGAPAGVLLILTCALFFWTVAFGVVHFAMASLKRRRAK